MRLSELQDDDKEAKKLSLERQQLPEDWENIEQMLYYQGLPYFLIVICLELISRHPNNPLADHFGIKKIS